MLFGIFRWLWSSFNRWQSHLLKAFGRNKSLNMNIDYSLKIVRFCCLINIICHLIIYKEYLFVRDKFTCRTSKYLKNVFNTWTPIPYIIIYLLEGHMRRVQWPDEDSSCWYGFRYLDDDKTWQLTSLSSLQHQVFVSYSEIIQ